jgi:hypothetical protein
MGTVPVYKDGASNSARIAIDPVPTQNMRIRTVAVPKVFCGEAHNASNVLEHI